MTRMRLSRDKSWKILKTWQMFYFYFLFGFMDKYDSHCYHFTIVIWNTNSSKQTETFFPKCNTETRLKQDKATTGRFGVL